MCRGSFIFFTSIDQKPECGTGFACHMVVTFLALVSFVVFVLLECSHNFTTLDMKEMLKIKQIGIFCFLVVEIFVKCLNCLERSELEITGKICQKTN